MAIFKALGVSTTGIPLPFATGGNVKHGPPGVDTVPARLTGGVRYTEIWLVHKDGRFQLDALTEGQN